MQRTERSFIKNAKNGTFFWKERMPNPANICEKLGPMCCFSTLIEQLISDSTLTNTHTHTHSKSSVYATAQSFAGIQLVFAGLSLSQKRK